MGTRADFYVGTGATAKWLGSVCWDGYEWEEKVNCPLIDAKTEKEFLSAVAEIASTRKDWTKPEDGWPWPWDNSFTTDRAYAFDDGHTKVFHWGKKPSKDENVDDVEVCDWPDMTEVRNVTVGPRSGVIVFGTRR